MEVTTRDSAQERTYIIRDKITAATIRELETDLIDFLNADGRDIIIDINEVTRLDSLTLAVFLKIKNMMLEKGRKMRLINPSESVRRVIEIASLDTFLLGKGE